MTTETLDKLYLEWSQLTQARTGREIKMRRALEAIIAEPDGCVFCDSGKLRNPDKPHTPDCGFALASEILSLGVTSDDELMERGNETSAQET